jgi:uncharacterized cupredoxin-like copper-binding protein
MPGVGGSRGRVAVLGCAAVAGLAGCGGATARLAAGGGSSDRAPAVAVTEHDFRIAMSAASVAAGAVTLRIRNAGPDEHELIVARARADGLPLRHDGFTVDEEALGHGEPGSVEPQQPGATTLLHLDLPPGRYVLFCNMEGHYMAGMHTALVVH